MTTSPALPSLTVEEVPIERLRPDPANPRRISEDELEALTRSLRQFGFVQPVLARREDRTVIGGHQRLVAARRLGLTTVPVIYLDLTAEQARLLGLVLNRISGSWDDALLARLLADLQATPDLDLSLSGFDEDEIRDLLLSLEARERRERPEAFDLDEALAEARRAPRTKSGDLWQLGDHRLLCGDDSHSVLFPDLGRDWHTLRESAERIAGLGDSLTVLRDGTARRRGRPILNLGALRTAARSRAPAQAGSLADTARAAALGLLGDTDGAVAIAERRLLTRER